MPTETTINLLVRRVRQRADQINSMTFDDATELKPWIKQSLAQLYEIMVSRYNDYYVTVRPLSLMASTDVYTLPSDFRCLHDVWMLGSGGVSRSRLQQFNAEEYAQASQMWNCAGPRRYRVMRNLLFLDPAPMADATNALEIWYTPMYRAPMLDYTPLDDVLPLGWEEWAVLDVLMKMAVKTRLLNSGDISASKKDVEARLISSAAIRTSDAPRMRDMFSTYQTPWLTGTPQGPAYWTIP